MTTPVRWGILGTARIAEKVSRAITLASDTHVAAVASRSADRASQWADEHDVPTSYGSYDELLNDEGLDAIYIPLPPAMHAEWTIRAAECGKHVLCEKPLALDVSQAGQMAAACRQHGVQLMDGVMWVHHPRAFEMAAPIRDGTLGEVRRVTSSFTFNHPFPADDLRMQRSLGGGSLLDLGWYCVRATWWATGRLPDRVYGAGRYENDVDVNFSAMMWLGDACMASFDCGFDTTWRRWMEIAGTSGTLVCDDFTKPWQEDRPRFWIHDAEAQATEHVSQPLIQEVCMVEAFCDAIRSGELNEVWPADAIATQRVCNALDESARHGRMVEIG